MWRVLSLVVSIGLTAFACNVSDPGGGADVDCVTVDDCAQGERCVNNECLPPVDNGVDGGTTEDATMPPDMSMMDAGVDAADSGDDMGAIECPDGFIDFNLDAADGCETAEFPGWQVDTCKACAGLPNAVAGCGGDGTCVVAACEAGFHDRDGSPQNGCEADCREGECWDFVEVVRDELIYLSGPDIWFASAPYGLVGRRDGDQNPWTFHSLGGPRDFNGRPVTNLHVADDVIYGIQAGRLVRSIDHGRSFGPVPNAPDLSTLDMTQNEADGSFYILTNDQTCGAPTCTADTDCSTAVRPGLSTCTATGVCGGAICETSFDCGGDSQCSADGFCVPRDTGCQECGICQAGQAAVYRTSDFFLFEPVGPVLPRVGDFSQLHVTPTGSVIANGPDDVYRFSTDVTGWERLDERNCFFKQFYFLQSGTGLAIGDGCSYEYDPQEGKFNNRGRFGGSPRDTLFVRDVVYATGDGFVTVSDNFGRNWDDNSLDGVGIHIYQEADGAVVVLGSRGEVWRSLDQGRSWAQDVDAFGPYPAIADSGRPLSLVGVGQQGGIITPADGNPVNPWLQIGPQTANRIEQDRGATFAYSGNAGLLTGLDWQNLTPLSITNQSTTRADFPSCPGTPCRVGRVVSLQDATFDGTNYIVVGRVDLQFRPSPFASYSSVGTPLASMISDNGVTWQLSEFRNPTEPEHLSANDFGILADRGFSNDGREWFTNGTAECGSGPFFRAASGDVLAFGEGRICRTTTGTDWAVENPEFWRAAASVTVDSIHELDSIYFTILGVPRGTVVNAANDITSWERLGPIWPPGTDLDFSSAESVSAHKLFFAVTP